MYALFILYKFKLCIESFIKTLLAPSNILRKSRIDFSIIRPRGSIRSHRNKLIIKFATFKKS